MCRDSFVCGLQGGTFFILQVICYYNNARLYCIKTGHFPQISHTQKHSRMRYFTGIVGYPNEKKWDISKNPFARRTRPAERPCRVSAFNRFLLYPPAVHTLDVLDFRLANKNRLKILSLKALRKQAQK